MRLFGKRRAETPAPPSIVYSFDGEPTLDRVQCGECAESHETVAGFVLANDSAFAVYWASWYPHQKEAWLDLTMGSWIEPDYEDHVMFGCRVGPVDGSDSPQCTAVTAGASRNGGPMLGSKLSRDEALAHEWLPTFWSVVDWLVLNDPLLHEHIFHMGDPPKEPGRS